MVHYHRASHLGAGSYGSVVTVYNDDGQEFALKLFLPDDDDEEERSDDSDSSSSWNDETTKRPMEIGALREISCLRLLRGDNRHEHIIELQDVQTEWDEDGECGGGAGTSGCLAMALPLGKFGSLANAIEKGTFQAYPKKAKVQIAHGLLSAVAFLHDNGILHRDIKSDNILLEQVEGSDLDWKPVLIDFSLAKPMDGTIWGQPDLHAKQLESIEHTGEVGTIKYTAPEIVKEEDYGKPADLFSVGVVLLELLQNRALKSEKASHVAVEIREAVRQLPDSAPFPDLVRRLLRDEPSERWTAREALEHPIFVEKFGFPIPQSPRFLNVSTALPYDNNAEEENEAPSLSKTPSRNRTKNKMERRLQRIDKILHELDSEHPFTRAAALEYSRQMEQLDDSMDDAKDASQALMDCCVLAHRFFERHVPDLDDLNYRDKGVFANWTLADYVDNEGSIFMLMDFCLYPRSLTC